jgi:hypothetical protein
MRTLIVLAALLFLGMAYAAIDLSGTSPDVAKSFATANSLDGFSDWVLPDFGHYTSEWWPEVDDLGRPLSLMNFSASTVGFPPSIDNNTTGA